MVSYIQYVFKNPMVCALLARKLPSGQVRNLERGYVPLGVSVERREEQIGLLEPVWILTCTQSEFRSQYKSNKVVESVTVSNWDPNTVNVHFSNVDPGYVMLEEMKSVRRGLVLTPCGASGNYWIAANNDYFALQKVRDTLESFDFELKEEKGKEWKYRRVVKC